MGLDVFHEHTINGTGTVSWWLRKFQDRHLISTIAAGGPLASAAVECLLKNRSPAAFPVVLSFIDHPDTVVRKNLLTIMRRFPRIPAGIDHRLILDLLKHQDPEVVEMAKWLANDLKHTPDEQRELDAVK